MRRSEELVVTLNSLLKNFEKESGDVVIGKMIPVFAALIVHLGNELDVAQRKVVRLTWALFWLTAVLLVIGVAQLVVSVNFPEPAPSRDPAKSAATLPTPAVTK